jgi:hypothetical protein
VQVCVRVWCAAIVATIESISFQAESKCDGFALVLVPPEQGLVRRQDLDERGHRPGAEVHDCHNTYVRWDCSIRKTCSVTSCSNANTFV